MEKVAVRSVDEAISYLGKICKNEVPAAAVVLGSGVRVLEELEDQQSVPYEDAFGISPGVIGHSGTLSLGRVNGKLVVVLRGRFHLYEGHDWDVVTLPSRIITQWGVPRFYLTNAAGGLNSSFNVGDLMLITSYRDHLNVSYKESGLLPALKRPATSCSNEVTTAVQEACRKLAAKDSNFRELKVGCYAGLLGPNYETLAEIQMLQLLGADAVGMSTVPELEACKGTATRPAAISVITNVWKPDESVGGHEEVLEAAKEASQRLDLLFRTLIA